MILYIVWHVSMDCHGTFRLFICSRVMNLDYCAERTNNNEEFGHEWWTKTNIYCGTEIPGSAFWWRSWKVSEYLSCYFWLMLTTQYGGYFFGCLVSERRSQIIAWYGFCVVSLKSDTAVALRRRLSKVPCIIVVSFINVYYEYFCQFMWLSAKSLHVLELLNIISNVLFFYLFI